MMVNMEDSMEANKEATAATDKAATDKAATTKVATTDLRIPPSKFSTSTESDLASL